MSNDERELQGVLQTLLGITAERPFVFKDGDDLSLHFDMFSTQSSMKISDPLMLYVDYTRAMMLFQLFVPAPKHIVIVGLGGGSLSKYCYMAFPEARITTLEINAQVIALRQRFKIPNDSERFRVIHTDAAHYFALHTIQADVILLDGFDATGLPVALSTAQFYQSCTKSLSTSGVLVSNLLGGPAKLQTYLQRINQACKGPLYFTTAHDETNTIAIGLQQAPSQNLTSLLKSADSLACTRVLDLHLYLESLKSWSATIDHCSSFELS